MQFLTGHSAGRKMLVAVSGQVMIVFIIVHVLGNATIFFGGLNAYAERLHSLPLLVWMTRLVMFAAVSVHVFFSIPLTLENRRAKPDAYAVKKHLKATVASRSMIWTGLIVAVFLVYHLLHFTFGVIHPALSAGMNADAFGRPDVSAMVMSAFRSFPHSFLYMAGAAALALHLIHGIQSSVQTLGLNSERTMPVVEKTGTAAAVVLLLGYIAIPVVILLGIMKG